MIESKGMPISISSIDILRLLSWGSEEPTVRFIVSIDVAPLESVTNSSTILTPGFKNNDTDSLSEINSLQGERCIGRVTSLTSLDIVIFKFGATIFNVSRIFD